jgi:hypothetical protein
VESWEFCSYLGDASLTILVDQVLKALRSHLREVGDPKNEADRVENVRFSCGCQGEGCESIDEDVKCVWGGQALFIVGW